MGKVAFRFSRITLITLILLFAIGVIGVIFDHFVLLGAFTLGQSKWG
jgi:hypothetical protein